MTIWWGPRAIHRKRLLNAARAVQEFDHSKDEMHTGLVCMFQYQKPCGSPACVLGHYALRSDLQDVFGLTYSGLITNIRSIGDCIDYSSIEIQDHFGISREEAEILFSSGGCGTSVTNGISQPKAVVSYIRGFVDRKYPEWESSAGAYIA